MANRDLLAIGTSAGGVEALRFLAGRLPADLPATVLVVIHLSSHFRSELDAILSQAGPLRASFANDGDRLERGRIYIARPERHLLVDGDSLRLGTGPRENFARPAIDPLFRSAALCCGPRTVGVVLTGALGDGASGLAALKDCGGIAVVQDPRDAAVPEMPANALSLVEPDHVSDLAAMPALLHRLVRQSAGAVVRVPDRIKYEVEVARSGHTNMSDMDRIGRRSLLACPDCHGVMWELDEGDLVRWRCHVGHAYTADLMALALDENLTRALAVALRALDERVALAERLSDQAKASGHARVAALWVQKAGDYEREAEVLRESVRRVDEIVARSAQAERAEQHDSAAVVTPFKRGPD